MRIWRSKREPVGVLLPLLRHVVPLKDGDCRLTMPVVRGRGKHDLPHEITQICVFKCGKSKSTTMKHDYNESANFIKNYDVDFDMGAPSNITEMVPVIGLEVIVSRARFRYTRDYFTPGICGIIKPAAFENWCHFPPNPRSHIIPSIHALSSTAILKQKPLKSGHGRVIS